MSLEIWIGPSLRFATSELPLEPKWLGLTSSKKKYLGKSISPTTPSIQKLGKHKLKILQLMLEDFQSVFDYFVDTRR